MSALLAAVTAPSTGRPTINSACFGEARFDGDATFNQAIIIGDALFAGTEISGDALFPRVTVGGIVEFDVAKIEGNAQFQHAKIDGHACFGGTKIGGDLLFGHSRVGGDIHVTAAEIEGDAWFSEAHVQGDARCDLVKLGGSAIFGLTRIAGDVHCAEAKIDGDAHFAGALLGRTVAFRGTRIGGDVEFSNVQINEGAEFDGVKIGGEVRFERAQIGAFADFDNATFGGDLWLHGAEIIGSITFRKVLFERAARVGPLVCTGVLDLSEAIFNTAVIIEAAAKAVSCRQTRWMSSATLRLRYAAVDLSDAVVEYPLSVAARPQPFALTRRQSMDEPCLTDPGVRIVSLRGMDAAHLVLNGVDLSDCLFAGTVHLDQVRLEGAYRLAPAPAGLRWYGARPTRRTPRRTLAEEHHWRAGRTRRADGWTPAPEGVDVLTPAELAPVYRAMRKSLEDGKHEPGAADFYYGEMEMRRHADDIPRSERGLLTAYWLLSGYGMRASRAFGWLLMAMTATILIMMLWGLPQRDPASQSTGIITGRAITVTTEAPDPVSPDEAYAERLSGERFDKSLRVVINSVVFRASGQDLTTIGTYTEMSSRLMEPVLLGLGVLAIRSRIKR